jgi:excisionase family DNA binding protein
MTAPRWLRAGEAAARLNIAIATLNRHTHAGTIPAARTLGGHHLYNSEVIDRIIRERTWTEEQAREVRG